MRTFKGQVILIVEEPKDRTDSGIYIPETAQEKSLKGIVQAVHQDNIGEIAIGDTVYFAKFSTVPFTVKNQDYMTVKIDDLLAIED